MKVVVKFIEIAKPIAMYVANPDWKQGDTYRFTVDILALYHWCYHNYELNKSVNNFFSQSKNKIQFLWQKATS